ncbi:MAG: 3-deoxy-D-manno-octulosonic acid transferase, partial [Phycisphaerales bacterium]
GARHAVVRYPIDFSWSVRRFLNATRPALVVLVELEIWPNFVRACSFRGIPVGVINGRLSERSFKGYRRIRRIIGPSFGRLAFAAVQDEVYAERFGAMGTPPTRLLISDTMKWDSAKVESTVAGAELLAATLGIDRTRPLIVAGSTGPDEELLLARACPPNVQLLCAPRKPERFDEAAAALAENGTGVVRLSACRAGAPRPAGAGRFLLDTIGDLSAAYALADIVVMGRSFGRLYGSDPIEPAGLGKPVLIGPRFQDFDSVVRTLRAAGGLEVVAPEALGPRLTALLNDDELRRTMCEKGRACVAAHRGATRRHAELIVAHASGMKSQGT